MERGKEAAAKIHQFELEESFKGHHCFQVVMTLKCSLQKEVSYLRRGDMIHIIGCNK